MILGAQHQRTQFWATLGAMPRGLRAHHCREGQSVGTIGKMKTKKNDYV
jgi:hypothetical protein